MAGARHRPASLRSQQHWLPKNGFDVLDPSTTNQGRDDLLRVVLVECLFGLVPLEEMEDAGILSIATDAIVDRSGLLLGHCTPCGLLVDCIDLVSISRIRKDGAVDGKFAIGDIVGVDVLLREPLVGWLRSHASASGNYLLEDDCALQVCSMGQYCRM